MNPQPLVLNFHGPNWIARLTQHGIELYTSKSCATKKHATKLAFAWAKKYGFTIGQVVS
jgi:hypothetical protein